MRRPARSPVSPKTRSWRARLPAESERLRRRSRAASAPHSGPARGNRGGLISRRDGREFALPAVPGSLPTSKARKRCPIVCAETFPGEQLAQVDNPDPFAPPVWRSPVHRTPEPLIWLVQLVRLIGRVIWFLSPPAAGCVAAVLVLVWLHAGWPGVAGLAADRRGAGGAAAGLAALVRPARHRPGAVPVAVVVLPAALAAVLTIAGLAPAYRGRSSSRSSARSGRCVHRPGTVRLVSGQSPADFADKAETWRTGSARCCAGSARHARARWSSSWSAATPWPSR